MFRKIALLLCLMTSLTFSQRLAYWPLKAEVEDYSYDYKYEAPTEIEKLVVRVMFRDIEAGRYWDAAALAKIYLPNVELIIGEDYVVIHENGDKGWAHLAINTEVEDNYIEEVAILVPHERNDLLTKREGEYVHSGLINSRYLLVNGSSRKYSDAARAPGSMYMHYVELISERPVHTRFISLHGNARPDCADVFMTDGTYGPDDHFVRNVKRNLRWRGVVNGLCGYRGITNLNGQLVRKNGDSFTHVEQSYGFRKYHYNKLLESIQSYYYNLLTGDQ